MDIAWPLVFLYGNLVSCVELEDDLQEGMGGNVLLMFILEEV